MMKGKGPADLHKNGRSDRTLPLPEAIGGSGEKMGKLNDGLRKLHPDILKKHEMETVVLQSVLRNCILRFEFHNFNNMISTVSQVNPATRLIDTNEL